MNSFRSLTKVFASATVIVLGSSLGIAATEPRNAPPADLAAAEVSQALDRLTAANEQRVTESIDNSITALAAKADDTVVTLNRPLDRSVGARFARDLRRAHRIRG